MYKKLFSSRIYGILMCVCIILSLLPLMFKGGDGIYVLHILDILTCCIFIADYVVRWYCYYRVRGVYGIFTYPFRIMAIVDLLSILPTLNVIAPIFKVARVSRLLRLVRVLKFVRHFEGLRIMYEVIYRQRAFLLSVLVMCLFYIFVTALIMFNIDDYLFESFFDAFYWSACTLTTVGYGDICPKSDIGRLVSIISSLMGIAVVALPSGIITASYLEVMRERKC